MKYLLSAFFILLMACGPSSIEDFRREGQALSHSLAEDLKEVQTRSELAMITPKLKKKIEKLVDLMITAKLYQLKHPGGGSDSEEERNFSDELLEELRRIYAMDGGRETIEKIQRDALLRLDAFDKSLQKRNSSDTPAFGKKGGI
jgi:hypothetical protein